MAQAINEDSVVFFKGDYQCETKHGLVTVTIPRDKTLAEVRHALSTLYRGGRNGS